MDLALLGKAAGMFVVTNVDDLLLLALYFGRAGGDRAAGWRVVVGQFLGMGAILAVSIVGALGAGLLPESVFPVLGLLPLMIGGRAAWQLWCDRGRPHVEEEEPDRGAGALAVAAVTFANGGDNISVYVPVFAVTGIGGMAGYSAVFLAGTAVWCALGWFLASRPPVARALARWGRFALPVALISIGTLIFVGV
ncbi:cadmium resistance transporter [Actinokineospora auranticolor]|uniref:Cadmium resistance protein CadD (Predicted permease) n=1 Tax=Actinokineospora auranticolor TaxID=155976 RepID=A0A2S6H0M5_9PSEU|nr:cadmium resistance transporter [Actinokineospora auranticolor]PPK71034.1 cadmium resistance protein CadD (predicted permease) [Actinokineospora auranticolor]